MTRFPKKLQDKLVLREVQNTFRRLPETKSLIDFSSNDYLGFSKNREIFERSAQYLSAYAKSQNGATGSRLLSGNHRLYSTLEDTLSQFHKSESALVFNSGYDANIGFFGSVPQRGDVVFYDELIHASIRDGIVMGNAKSYKFRHNDIADLKKRCRTILHRKTVETPVANAPEVYIITESVFSMDGDSPNLVEFSDFCQEMDYHLIIDEAHAVGVLGKNGEGLVQKLELQDAVFARIITFGKAIGCHGAAILGSQNLKHYLVNFARSLIYTTGLPPHSVATILASYEYLSASARETASNKDSGEVAAKHPIVALRNTIDIFKSKLKISAFIPSDSAIHCCVLPGNDRVRALSENIQKEGFDVKPILSPTVAKGHERLRICLHSFNTEAEIERLLKILSLHIKEE